MTLFGKSGSISFTASLANLTFSSIFLFIAGSLFLLFAVEGLKEVVSEAVLPSDAKSLEDLLVRYIIWD